MTMQYAHMCYKYGVRIQQANTRPSTSDRADSEASPFSNQATIPTGSIELLIRRRLYVASIPQPHPQPRGRFMELIRKETEAI